MENNKTDQVMMDYDDAEEERKMEKFYSLLRNFRDARDRRRRELQEIEKSESNTKRIKTTATKGKEVEASFEWQDFTTEIHFRKPPSNFPTPIPCEPNRNNKGKKKKEQQFQDHHSLDLKLAL